MADPNEMTQEQAVLYSQAYVPAFIEKCASLGLEFPNEQALNEALETTALVKVAMSRRSDSTIKQANRQLKAQLGVDRAEARNREHTAVKSAAEVASQNPAVRQALLTGLLAK